MRRHDQKKIWTKRNTKTLSLTMTMTIIISNANKTPSKNFSQIKFESYVAFEAFGQSDEEP